MGTHSITWLDSDGSTEDQEFFCSARCMFEALEEADVARDCGGSYELAGERDGASWGGWPGGVETDTDVYCGSCTDHMWHGLDCYGDNREPIHCPDEAVFEHYARSTSPEPYRHF